jgi:hypothetical protein
MSFKIRAIRGLFLYVCCKTFGGLCCNNTYKQDYNLIDIMDFIYYLLTTKNQVL